MEKNQESYVIFNDGNGWKLLHPETGICSLVINNEIVEHISFDKRVIGTFRSNNMAFSSDDIFETKKDLLSDGYSMSEIKKMKLKIVNIAELLEIR